MRCMFTISMEQPWRRRSGVQRSGIVRICVLPQARPGLTTRASRALPLAFPETSSGCAFAVVHFGSSRWNCIVDKHRDGEISCLKSFRYMAQVGPDAGPGVDICWRLIATWMTSPALLRKKWCVVAVCGKPMPDAPRSFIDEWLSPIEQMDLVPCCGALFSLGACCAATPELQIATLNIRAGIIFIFVSPFSGGRVLMCQPSILAGKAGDC